MLSLALALAASPGCASAEVRALESDLVGQWRGDPVDPPEGAWFEKAQFDVYFGHGDDFSAVAKTFAGKSHDLHFAGGYEVETEKLIRIWDEHRDLGGEWLVERGAKGELTISRGDITIALRKRHGS